MRPPLHLVRPIPRRRRSLLDELREAGAIRELLLDVVVLLALVALVWALLVYAVGVTEVP
jgi:hypothetical protein